MIGPMLKVLGCVDGSDGALAGLLDRDRLGCALDPNNTTSSRLPAHVLSRPLSRPFSTITGEWACFAVNCALSSGCQSSRVAS